MLLAIVDLIARLETLQSKHEDLCATVSGDKVKREKLIISLEERLRALEKQVNDTANQRSDQVQPIYTRIDNVDSALQAKHESLNQFVESLHESLQMFVVTQSKGQATIEESLKELKDKHALLSSDGEHLEERLEALENEGDEHKDFRSAVFATVTANSERMSRALDELSSKAKKEVDTTRQRLAFLENLFGESADIHGRHAKEI